MAFQVGAFQYPGFQQPAGGRSGIWRLALIAAQREQALKDRDKRYEILNLLLKKKEDLTEEVEAKIDRIEVVEEVAEELNVVSENNINHVAETYRKRYDLGSLPEEAFVRDTEALPPAVTRLRDDLLTQGVITTYSDANIVMKLIAQIERHYKNQIALAAAIAMQQETEEEELAMVLLMNTL